jgi:hypothetical protein
MKTIEPLDQEELIPEMPSNGNLKALKAELERRCKLAKIPIEDTEGFEEGQMACRIGMPCGRDHRWVYCWDETDYQRMLDISFERFVCLQGLDAICDYAGGQIEASVKGLGAPSTRLLYNRVFGIPSAEFLEREGTVSLTLDALDGQRKTTITLGPCSKELSVLSFAGPRPRLSLKISRDGLTQHDAALELLRRLSDALFFQIDLLHEVSLTLGRDRRSTARRRSGKRPNKSREVAFPTHEYDAAPISLYWYARSAVGMPLLQFLAFYQVIEYYYPTYSQAEARRKIRGILKDPSFRGDRDADLGRVLSAIHVSRSGAFGDERSQLRATLAECVDPQSLREFIEAYPARAAFLSSKTKGLCEQKIAIGNLTADLRVEVAERIYEIRCKIVHTKTDAKNGEFELLLPFSKEAEQLSHDIDLAQFLAQQVLIAASSPLQP